MMTSAAAHPLFSLVIASLLIASLTACETLGLKSSGKKSDTIDIACPPVDAPGSLSSTVKDGASANLRIAGSKCTVNDDSVVMRVDVDLTATRGSRARQTELALPFFAAITGKDNQLLNKKMYETTFTFSDDNTTDREQISISFTLTREQAATTQVTIGYQVSRDAWQLLIK